MADEIDSGMTVGLEEEIMADLSAELSLTDPNFSISLLLPKVKNAMREVKRARNYPASYTDVQIEADMYNYYSNNHTQEKFISKNTVFIRIIGFLKIFLLKVYTI